MSGVWEIAPSEVADGVELILRQGPPRPLVATLTEEEFERLLEVLRPVEDAVRRNEFSRVQLASICQDAIGRDPFMQERPVSELPSLWSDVLPLATGAIAVTGHHVWWLRLVGWALVGYGVYGLARRAWRRLSRRGGTVPET